MAIGSNPLRSTILSMTYRDGQRIEVHPVVRLTLLDRLRRHEGSKGTPPTHPTQIRPHGLGALKAGQWTTTRVPQGNNCRVDLRGKYADGQSADASNVDVCADK